MLRYFLGKRALFLKFLCLADKCARLVLLINLHTIHEMRSQGRTHVQWLRNNLLLLIGLIKVKTQEDAWSLIFPTFI